MSPTTPRVKHVRRLSHDFEHPPPPPTPPPPSPSLPEEPEPEEDDDVAESVISDWALDGDNDEIHEVADAPPADAAPAEATPEPAATQHADPHAGENTLGLDIGGEPTRASQPGEPTPEPTASTTSTEESLIDFEDAPETTSQASLEHSTDAADPVAQPVEVDTARHDSADLQVIEETAAVQPTDREGVSPSVNVPETTEEPPSDALNRDDPPRADKDASTGAGSDDAPGIVSFNDDLGDPLAPQSESETQAGPSEESTTVDVTRMDEGTDSEVHVEADTGREPAAPTELGSSTSSLASGMEATGPEAARDVPAEVKGDAASPLEDDRSRPAAETRDKDLPSPPESPENVHSAEQPTSSTRVAPANEAHRASLCGDQNEDASRGDDGEHADHRDMFSTGQQDEEPSAKGAPPAVQHDTGTPSAAEVVESASQEKHSPQSPSSVAVEPDTQTADEAPSGDKRLPEDSASRGRSTLITSVISKDPPLSTDAGSTSDTPSTEIPLGSAASDEKTETEELRDAAAEGSEETSGGNVEIEDTEGRAEAQVDTHGGQRVAEAGEEEGTRIPEAPASTDYDYRPNSTSVAEEPKPEDADDRVHMDALRSQPSNIHEGDDSGLTGSAEDAHRSSEQRHPVPSPPSVESKAPPVVSGPPISPTVTLADGAEVLIVGRDPEGEDETGKAPTFPVPSSAAVPIAVTTPPTAFHPPSEVDSGSTTRSSPTPWPASPGVNALVRTARSPPSLKTDFPSPSTFERSLSRSAVFSPQHHQMLVQTPTSSISKSPAWGFTARSILSSVTSAFASGPVSPHSSPSSTRDSSQEPTTVPRADTRATPPARKQVAWGGNKQWSPAVASPSFGQLRAPSPSTPPVVEQRPDQATSLQPVENELSEAMSDGVPGLREEQLQNSESANPRSGSPTRDESQLPDSKSGDADAEDFVQVGPSDLACEGCTSDDVKRDEVVTSEHVLSSGHAGVSTAGDGGSNRSGGEDADEDTPLAHVSRLLKATPQTPSSEPTSDMEDDMDGPESPLERPTQTDDTAGATNASKKKKKKKKGRRG